MASCCSSTICGALPTLPHPRTRFKSPYFSIAHSQSLSFNSCIIPTSIFLEPKLQICSLTKRHHHPAPSIFAVQSNFFKAIQKVFKVGRDGVEAGTNLVPDVVPRPVARLSVTVVAAAVSLFVLRSFVSTVLFALGFMGFVYFVYLALTKDKGPKLEDKPGSTDEAIEEAKKIMDKYK